MNSDEIRPGAIVEAASGTEGAPDGVLVVDDEVGVRDLMARWLRMFGYAVLAAGSAEEALARLDEAPVAVALCDIRMPGRDGLWLAEQIRRRQPDTAVVMATGVQDVGSAVASLRHGVIDYLMKPFGRDRLREAVLRGIEWHRGAIDARRADDEREREMTARQHQLALALGGLQIDSRDAVEAMIAMLTIHDRGVLDHCRQVAVRAAATARALDLGPAAVEELDRAALTHEIDKLTLPENIVRKVGPLSAREEEIVRSAPGISHALLSAVPFLSGAADVLRARYERWDGQGYPLGLRSEDIPIGSRVLAVVDSYETMTRPRRFQPALPEVEALQELERCSGTQFDPFVVTAFRRVLGLPRPASQTVPASS